MVVWTVVGDGEKCAAAHGTSFVTIRFQATTVVREDRQHQEGAHNQTNGRPTCLVLIPVSREFRYHDEERSKEEKHGEHGTDGEDAGERKSNFVFEGDKCEACSTKIREPG